MKGPPPKPPALRQRRNRIATKATLPSEAEAADYPVPDLHPRNDGKAWHANVLAWWRQVWCSPMAAEYLEVDFYGLAMLAELHQVRWTATGLRTLVDASKEIRQQEVRFGLSPIDRRRLDWIVSRDPEQPQRKGARRVQKDPRARLTVEDGGRSA